MLFFHVSCFIFNIFIHVIFLKFIIIVMIHLLSHKPASNHLITSYRYTYHYSFDTFIISNWFFFFIFHVSWFIFVFFQSLSSIQHAVNTGATTSSSKLLLYHYFIITHIIHLLYLIMGWLRLVDSLKCQVSFAKSPIKEPIFCQRDS